MKKFILGFFVLAMAFTACQKSEEAKIKEAVKSHIKEGKDEKVTYEPVEFGELDSMYLKLEETDRYKTLTDTSRMAGKIAGMRIRMKTAPEDEKEKDRKELEQLKESMQKKRKELKKFIDSYEPRLKGFSVPHTYKLDQNKLEHVFQVDTNYKVVDTLEQKPKLD